MRTIDQLAVKRLSQSNLCQGIWLMDEKTGNVIDKNGGAIYASVGSGVQRLSEDNERYPHFFRFTRSSTSALYFNSRVIPTGSFSLCFSIRMASKPTAENQEVISGAYARSTDAGIRIWVDTNGLVTFTGCYKNSTYYSFTISDSAFPYGTGQWVDYMLTLDASTRLVKVYKNSQLFSTATSRTPNNQNSSYNLVIGRQPNTSYARYFAGDLCDFQVYRKVLTPEDFILRTSLVKDSLVFKTNENGSWVTVAEDVENLTDELFVTRGIMEHSMLDRVSDVSPLDTLPEGSELYTWTNGQDVEVSFERPTAPQDVIPTTDILFAGLERIDSFAITGSATSKVAFSNDGGLTWKKFSDDEWLEISSISDGNSVSEIPNIPTGSLFEFASKNNKLRLAYHIKPGETVTLAKILATIKGPTVIAPKASYDLSYDEPTSTIQVKILVNGDYFVNYMDAE